MKPIEILKRAAFGSSERRKLQADSKEILQDLNQFTYLPDSRQILTLERHLLRDLKTQEKQIRNFIKF